MDVAKEVLSGILGLLHPEDRVAIILFDDSTCQPKQLGLVACADVPALQDSIVVSAGA